MRISFYYPSYFVPSRQKLGLLGPLPLFPNCPVNGFTADTKPDLRQIRIFTACVRKDARLSLCLSVYSVIDLFLRKRSVYSVRIAIIPKRDRFRLSLKRARLALSEPPDPYRCLAAAPKILPRDQIRQHRVSPLPNTQASRRSLAAKFRLPVPLSARLPKNLSTLLFTIFCNFSHPRVLVGFPFSFYSFGLAFVIILSHRAPTGLLGNWRRHAVRLYLSIDDDDKSLF
ncbi:hypothetical protein BZA70DRAFT_54595 [Myxozyma melibiosi]|uniref:Uncharacterized protein n=1 Tax=Myxozyma melibiosi TaxID=54550 RepID=A0ABR1FFD8_9ASCO